MASRLLEMMFFHAREPPPRLRDPSKPMQVICPGFPRCGTESLQIALLKLGYDHTYHGFDTVFEEQPRLEAWTRLARKKLHGSDSGESNITAADFDALLGHCVAVADAPAAAFAAELINAYPSAKVVLNRRKDIDAWHRSAVANIAVAFYQNWPIYISSWFTWYGYWTWNMFGDMWAILLHSTRANPSYDIKRNGKRAYKEHFNMIRGLVLPENLLEWCVEDGWEPLCKFLDKPIPDEPFPSSNNTAAFAGRIAQWQAEQKTALIRNVSTFVAVVTIGGVFATGSFPTLNSSFRQFSKSIFDLVRSIRR